MSCWSPKKKENSKFDSPEVESALREVEEFGCSREEILVFYSEFRAITGGEALLNEGQFLRLLNELCVF